MTKRILAVIMAIVMSLSVLSLSAFAADWNQPTLTYDSAAKTMTVTWNAHPDASAYSVILYRDGSQVQNSGTVAKSVQKFTFNNITAGGNYQAAVTATLSTGSAPETINSNIVNVPTTLTVGNVTVTSSGTGATVSWTAVANISSYVVEYTYFDSSSNTTKTHPAVSVAASSTSYTISDVTFANLRTVTVSYLDSSLTKRAIGTVNVQNGTGSSGTTGGTGSVSLTGGYLTWGGSTAVRIAVSVNGSLRGYLNQLGQIVTNSASAYVTGSSISVASIISSLGYSYSYITFTVYDYASNKLLGASNYTNSYYYGNNYYYGSLTVVPNQYSNTAYVSWYPYTNAASYYVEVTSLGYTDTVPSSTTYANITYRAGIETTIRVAALNSSNQIIAYVGTAVINANGQVSNSTSTYSNTSGSVINGNNCTLTVGTTSSSLTFYPTNGAYGVYNIAYTVDGNTQSMQTTSTTVTIPVGYNKSFSVMVIAPMAAAYGGSPMVASVNYTASVTNSSSSNATTSYTRNITLTAKNSSTTTVSWEKVANATMYEVDYIRSGANTTEPIYTTQTSCDIPMGKSVGFEVNVYAYVGSRVTTVGSAVHKAGDEFTTTQSSDNNNSSTTKPKDEPKLSAYVTGFKGTVGKSGSITLAWNAASGEPNYEVWYKKSTASTWKKIYTTAGRALKINKLTNGTSYDFKIVANGRDSGILTMTIGTTSSTKTAADPEGAGTTTSSVPVINSITGGSGSITVSWSAASGCTKYQVWVNKSGTTTYTKKATVDGTSATITGLDAGSYKVRIKASKDGSTWYNFNDSNCIKSDYRTVDVK